MLAFFSGPSLTLLQLQLSRMQNRPLTMFGQRLQACGYFCEHDVARIEIVLIH